MANFDDQVRGLTNITISSSGTNPTEAQLTQFLTDGAKELINLFPLKLKEKCATETTLDNSTTTMDMDDVGEILFVNRLSADSSGFRFPCRKIPSMYGGMAESSSGHMMYEPSVTDPVYWISSSSDASILNVRPTPESTQTAIVYHIGYPTVAYNGDGTITNFPDEAEYLVVLYAAIKSLQSAMGSMNASIVHSDQDGYDASSSSSQGWEKVRDWLESEEDSEMSAATVQALSAELQQFVTEYQWYQSQQATLKQDYQQGIMALIGKGVAPQKAGGK